MAEQQERVQHVVSMEDFTRDQIEDICCRADMFRQADTDNVLTNELAEQYKGQTIATLFEEPSTRTRGSSTVAAGKLGMNVFNLGVESSSMVKGETLGRTAITLGALGCKMAVMRMKDNGAVKEAAEMSKIPIINGGDGWNEHPTQAWLDIETVMSELGQIDRTKWVIFNELNKSRTVNSLLIALSKFDDVEVVLAAPNGYKASDLTRQYLEKHGLKYYETSNLQEAAKDADVLYGVRRQNERHQKGRRWWRRDEAPVMICDQAVVSVAKPDVVLAHAGPHNEEMPDYLYDLQNAAFPERQVSAGLYTRVALFDWVLGSKAINSLMDHQEPHAQRLDQAA